MWQAAQHLVHAPFCFSAEPGKGVPPPLGVGGVPMCPNLVPPGCRFRCWCRPMCRDMPLYAAIRRHTPVARAGPEGGTRSPLRLDARSFCVASLLRNRARCGSLRRFRGKRQRNQGAGTRCQRGGRRFAAELCSASAKRPPRSGTRQRVRSRAPEKQNALGRLGRGRFRFGWLDAAICRFPTRVLTF
jgi:hypothetical protein